MRLALLASRNVHNTLLLGRTGTTAYRSVIVEPNHMAQSYGASGHLYDASEFHLWHTIDTFVLTPATPQDGTSHVAVTIREIARPHNLHGNFLNTTGEYPHGGVEFAYQPSRRQHTEQWPEIHIGHDKGRVVVEEHANAVLSNLTQYGWQGKSLALGGGDIEDQNALMFAERLPDGQLRTVIKMKLRPSAQDKMLRHMRHLGFNVSRKPKYTTPTHPREFQHHAGITMHASGFTHTVRRIHGGDLYVEADQVAPDVIAPDGSALKDLLQYNLDFGNGMRMTYRPWDHGRFYALTGEIEICLPGIPDAWGLGKALTRLVQLGVDLSPVNDWDTELMYLLKQAYISGVSEDPNYIDLMAELQTTMTSPREAVLILREFWSEKLGVGYITSFSHYQPRGVHQISFRDDNTVAGWHHQYRFDLSPEELTAEIRGHTLFHSLQAGDITGSLARILDGTGALISLAERIRLGIPISGTAPLQDLESGGGNYVFTRIQGRKLPEKSSPGLYLKIDLLRRMDVIAYDHNAYGNTKGKYTAQHRLVTPEQWRDSANSPLNEANFKNSITLIDNLDYIVVGSEAERALVLLIFQNSGITRLPDGRYVQEIIFVNDGMEK